MAEGVLTLWCEPSLEEDELLASCAENLVGLHL